MSKDVGVPVGATLKATNHNGVPNALHVSYERHSCKICIIILVETALIPPSRFRYFFLGSDLDHIPYGESACRDAVLKLGLQLGGHGYAFAAPKEDGYQIGCYGYKDGKYKDMAFYGYGGDNDEVSKPFDENSEYYRPKGYDSGIEGIFYDFASSMSKP